MSTDRIEKRIVLHAPRARVWRALTDPHEFGRWFGARLTGAFAPGAHIAAQLTIPGHEHVKFELVVETVEPEVMLAFRWHPAPGDPEYDYTSEPMTLVEFRLAEVADGTELTVSESGFDRLPPSRRAQAFRMNERGWAAQLQNIHGHVSA
ncbi:MAG TPA: SRPBCC family protein [Chloroflexota bacterium]|nr:SRPBCC family protein [Chloroflexota bacterium]